MRSFISLFSLAFILAFLLTPIVRHWVRRWQVWSPTEAPSGGGLSLMLTLMLTLSVVPLLDNLLGETFRQEAPRLLPLVLPTLLIFALGFIDDLRPLSLPLKFSVQFIVATLVFISEFQIVAISLPQGSRELPWLLSYLLTLLWLLGVTNAFVLLASKEGVATMAAAAVLFAVLLLSLAQGVATVSISAMALLGATLAFLLYNFNPTTIRLGTSGKLLLGFAVAILSLVSKQKGAAFVAVTIPLVALNFPLAEVFRALLARWWPLRSTSVDGAAAALPPLPALTLQQRVIALYGLGAIAAFFGVLLFVPERSFSALIFFIFGLVTILGLQHQRLAHVFYFGAANDRSATISIASNEPLRRLQYGLRKAQSLEHIHQALAAWLADNQLLGATLQLNGHQSWHWQAPDARESWVMPPELVSPTPLASGMPPVVPMPSDQSIAQVSVSSATLLRLPLLAGDCVLGTFTVYARSLESCSILAAPNFLRFLEQELRVSLLRFLPIPPSA